MAFFEGIFFWLYRNVYRIVALVIAVFMIAFLQELHTAGYGQLGQLVRAFLWPATIAMAVVGCVIVGGLLVLDASHRESAPD